MSGSDGNENENDSGSGGLVDNKNSNLSSLYSSGREP